MTPVDHREERLGRRGLVRLEVPGAAPLRVREVVSVDDGDGRAGDPVVCGSIDDELFDPRSLLRGEVGVRHGRRNCPSGLQTAVHAPRPANRSIGWVRSGSDTRSVNWANAGQRSCYRVTSKAKGLGGVGGWWHSTVMVPYVRSSGDRNKGRGDKIKFDIRRIFSVQIDSNGLERPSDDDGSISSAIVGRVLAVSVEPGVRGRIRPDRAGPSGARTWTRHGAAAAPDDTLAWLSLTGGDARGPNPDGALGAQVRTSGSAWDRIRTETRRSGRAASLRSAGPGCDW